MRGERRGTDCSFRSSEKFFRLFERGEISLKRGNLHDPPWNYTEVSWWTFYCASRRDRPPLAYSHRIKFIALLRHPSRIVVGVKCRWAIQRKTDTLTCTVWRCARRFTERLLRREQHSVRCEVLNQQNVEIGLDGAIKSFVRYLTPSSRCKTADGTLKGKFDRRGVGKKLWARRADLAVT